MVVSGAVPSQRSRGRPVDDDDGVLHQVIDASNWPVAGLETDGKTEHMWLRRPGDDRPWLFKAVVRHGARRQGEDWVEKLASVLAHDLGIPRADVDLADREGTPGCLVRDIKPHQWQLYSGADLLEGLLGNAFDPADRFARGHRLDTIEEVLAGYRPPSQSLPSGMNGFDVFASYLMLDALIANRDRHPRNWAVLQPPAHSSALDTLAPSFDHASGLGFGLTDQERSRWLDHPGVTAWTMRGTAKCFEHGSKPWPSLVDVALRAMCRCSSETRAFWRGRLEELTEAAIADEVDALPDLSDVTRTFTTSVITINRGRLLEESW